MTEHIYLDNAATSLYRPPCVAEAVMQAMAAMGNDSRGTHREALASSRILYETRCLLCELFGGSGPEQVAFSANVTQALNTAIKGLVGPGDALITTVLEHNSVLRPAYEMKEKGAALSIAGCDGVGNLDYDMLEEQIRRQTKQKLSGEGHRVVVVTTHASNFTGNLVDIHRVGQLCRAYGAVYVLDAAQTAGIFPIHMEEDGVDVVCFTGHKSLMGPQGTGGLCVKRGLTIRPLLSGGSGILTYQKKHPQQMPAALEAGTQNGHGIAGLRAGLLYIKEQGMERLRKKEQALTKQFYEGICGVAGVTIYGDFSSFERAPIVSLNIGAMDSGEVSDILSEDYGIDTRPGGHCAPLMHRIFGCESQGAVRFSFSHMNTSEQVDAAVRAVRLFKAVR